MGNDVLREDGKRWKLQKKASEIPHVAFAPGDWRIPYIGRTVTERFWREFFVQCEDPNLDYQVKCGCNLLCAEGGVENDYDSSGSSSTLVVFVQNNTIIDIVVEFYSWWSTSSNFHDVHDERNSVSYGVEGSEKTINDCKRKLDQSTAKWSGGYLLKLLEHIHLLLPSWDIQRNNDGWMLVYRREKNSQSCRVWFDFKDRQFERLIENAYCLLDVFWGGFCSNYNSLLLLNFINLDKFYGPTRLAKLTDECVERLKIKLKDYKQFMGLSESLFEEQIRSRVRELADDDSRFKLGLSKLENLGSLKGSVKLGMFQSRRHYGYAARPFRYNLNAKFGRQNEELIYAFPEDALCFYDSFGEIVGFVDSGCRVYKAEPLEPEMVDSWGYLRFRREEPRVALVGRLEGGKVLDSDGKVIAHFDSKGLSHNKQYFLRHDEQGLILAKSKFVGFADIDNVEVKEGQWCGLYLLDFLKDVSVEKWLTIDQGLTIEG